MKAVLNGLDGHLHWDDVSDPVLRNDSDVIIRVYAAAINRADLLQRAGQYPPPDGWPKWFGLEVSGIIVQLGKKVQDEGRLHIGDRVCALLGGGGYAQYVAVPEGMVMPIPKGVTMTEAAALPEVFGAAYLFLYIEGKIKKDDCILVQAGASGLASVVIPMAKSAGARVMTTVLNEQVAESIKHLHADVVINTSKDKLSDVLQREKSAGHGVDIVIDCLGGDTVGECLPYLNYGGRWIMIATLANDFTNVDLRKMYVNNTRLIGTTLRSRSSDQKKAILQNLVRDIWPKVESGEIRPTIWRVYPITKAEEAQKMMAEGKSVGKIVLKVIDGE